PGDVAAVPAQPIAANPTADDTGASLQPQPVQVAQGSSCIEGTVIDRYHVPVPGWTVRATLSTTGGPQYTAVTDQNGKFVFGGLSAGTWTLTQDLQEGWQPVTASTFDVTVSGSAGPCSVVRFKNERLVTVIGTKTECKYGLGLAGWTITAIHQIPGGQVLTATTNGLGQYQFTNLLPGTWTFREEQQVGWEPYLPPGGEKTLTLVSPHSTSSPYVVNFVNNQVTGPIIKVCKVDELRQGLSGWQFSVRPANGTRAPIYGTTGRDGCVVFSKGLDFGTWIVEEHPTASQSQQWCPVTQTQQQVELKDPGVVVQALFQNKPCGCVRVRKINSLHQGLEGWTIYARKGDGTVLTQVTDRDGYTTFYHLEFGTWTFSEEMKPGWEPVTPSEVQVPVSRQSSCEQVLFKNRTRTAMLVVYKKDYYGKVGLPGWTITIQPKYGGTAQSKVTDGTGRAEFTNLDPGWYVVSEVAQSGWVPVSASSVTIELKVTGVPAEHTFWNRQSGSSGGSSGGGSHNVWYTVQYGDTLSGIAARYGTTVSALSQANGIYYPYTIYAGQRIYIP
ncbi:MAG: carboxypeptidase regulatory-like domain-containing protein, partial [Chloroflexi bacterium]|nr:carboxypeptidase regulatory-like domain-containing protein [Chloroflexota bacterium]